MHQRAELDSKTFQHTANLKTCNNKAVLCNSNLELTCDNYVHDMKNAMGLKSRTCKTCCSPLQSVFYVIIKLHLTASGEQHSLL